jgi:hypothetical protein
VGPSTRHRPTTIADLAVLATSGTLFAILDACDDPEVQAKVKELGEDRAPCLYRGVTDAKTLAAAPYLVHLDAELLEWAHATLWSRPWGILVVSKSDPKSVRHHLRKLLVVKGPEHQALYFRYYDPRVLATYLPTLSKNDLDEVFGPVLAYGTGDPTTGGAELTYR